MFEKEIVLGNKIIVTDPCYDINVWCQGVIDNIEAGEYICKANINEEGRVSSIYVSKKGAPLYDINECSLQDFCVGVDSGQAGVFDYDYYIKNTDDSNKDLWYDRICDLTFETIKNPGYIPIVKRQFFKDELESLKTNILDFHKKNPLIDVYVFVAEYFGMVDDLRCITEMSNFYAFLADNGVEKGIAVSENDEFVDTKTMQIISVNDEKKEQLLKEKKALESFAIDMSLSFLRSQKRDDKENANKGCYCEIIGRYSANSIDEKGYVSSAGYGDGSYDCYTHTNNNGLIDCIIIKFI